MKQVVSIILLLILCNPINSYANGKTKRQSEQIEIHFNQAGYAVRADYADNKKNLDSLSNLIQELNQDPRAEITAVEINSYTSPEGGMHYNKALSERRSASIYKYITEELAIADSLITMSHSGIDWLGLRSLVAESDVVKRDKVLNIIDNTPEETWRHINPTDKFLSLVDSREKHLQELYYGRPYRYIYKNFYPQLRRGSVVTVYFTTLQTPLLSEEIAIAPQAMKSSELTSVAKPYTPLASEQEEWQSEIKFALKTNLLFDAVTALNVEAEVPIGDKWSVAGEWIFPWWVTKNNGNALEVLSGQLEGRYWLGDRTNKPQLTGWFAGLYAGGGLYDLQYKNNGYQGEFYIAAGASAGYAHTINKRGNLRMEYSLGLGYLSTEYRYYEGRQDNQFLVWQHDGKYTWLGPTRAKVSLVWFIDWKRGGKR